MGNSKINNGGRAESTQAKARIPPSVVLPHGHQNTVRR